MVISWFLCFRGKSVSVLGNRSLDGDALDLKLIWRLEVKFVVMGWVLS